jgi:hypothetical protein
LGSVIVVVFYARSADHAQRGQQSHSLGDEQAKAIQEALKGLGDFLREVLGTVPSDVVGLLGGDWLKVRRAENLARIVQKARDRMKQRDARPQPASLAVGLPLLAAAANEDRDELQEVWAQPILPGHDFSECIH